MTQKLPILKPAPCLTPEEMKAFEGWDWLPQVDINNSPLEGCPKCGGGRYWRVPGWSAWYCLDCLPPKKGPCILFVGEVKR